MRSGSGEQDAERRMKKDSKLTLDDQWKNLNQGNAETCHHNHVTEIKAEHGPYGEEKSKTERSKRQVPEVTQGNATNQIRRASGRPLIHDVRCEE